MPLFANQSARWTLAAAVILVAGLSACSSGGHGDGASGQGGAKGENPAAGQAAAGGTAHANGQQIFDRSCKVCHSLSAGTQGIGPDLAGIVDRPAGNIPGFVYSAGMKAAEPWSEAQLDAFIQAPQKVVPGSRMAFAGLIDAGERAALIAYLKSVK